MFTSQGTAELAVEEENFSATPFVPSEGDPSWIQLMHEKPRVEDEIRHHSGNTRYGHRWCNVAAADMEVKTAVDVMRAIVSKWSDPGDGPLR